jgi:hypothetical protein
MTTFSSPALALIFSPPEMEKETAVRDTMLVPAAWSPYWIVIGPLCQVSPVVVKLLTPSPASTSSPLGVRKSVNKKARVSAPPPEVTFSNPPARSSEPLMPVLLSPPPRLRVTAPTRRLLLVKSVLSLPAPPLIVMKGSTKAVPPALTVLRPSASATVSPPLMVVRAEFIVTVSLPPNEVIFKAPPICTALGALTVVLLVPVP